MVSTSVVGRQTIPDLCPVYGWQLTTVWVNCPLRTGLVTYWVSLLIGFVFFLCYLWFLLFVTCSRLSWSPKCLHNFFYLWHCILKKFVTFFPLPFFHGQFFVICQPTILFLSALTLSVGLHSLLKSFPEMYCCVWPGGTLDPTYLTATGHFVWLVRPPGTVYHSTFVRHQHYQRSKTCSRHICALVPTSPTICFHITSSEHCTAPL